MSHAIVIHQPGGPEVLRYESVSIPALQPEEVLVRHSAIGVNYIDIYYRKGLYSQSLPFTPGIEAVGTVEALGDNVDGLKIGDRVAYATVTSGAYAEYRAIHRDLLVHVNDEISDEIAAASLVKGMTAHYLTRRTFMVRPDQFVLVHAAAGGVGQMICQFAKAAKATVIGLVGSDEKKPIASQSGCHYVFNYQTENWVNQVKEITGTQGIQVVYDSVGKATFLQSIECLGSFGLMVSYGQSSGPIPPFDLQLLSKNSLFITRPSLFAYKQHRMELILTAAEIYEMIKTGKLRPQIFKKFKLKDAAKAHQLLESRTSTGSIILSTE